MISLIPYESLTSTSFGLNKKTWLVRRSIIVKDVSRLIELTNEQFVKTLDSSGIDEFLDSFLLNFNESDVQADLSESAPSIFTLVFHLVEKIARECDREIVRRILSFDRLIDFLMVYQPLTNRISSLLDSLIAKEPKYLTDDCRKCVDVMIKVLETILKSLAEKGNEAHKAEYLLENIGFVENMLKTLVSLSLNSEIGKILVNNESGGKEEWTEQAFISAKKRRNDSGIVSLIKLIDQLFWFGLTSFRNDDDDLCRIIGLAVLICKTYRNIVDRVYLEVLADLEGQKRDRLLEKLIEEIMDVCGQESFAAIYDECFGVNFTICRIQSLTDAGISESHVNYLTSLVTKANSRLFGDTTKEVPRFVEGDETIPAAEAEIQADIDGIKELFPDLSDEFLIACLDSLTTNERVIHALLEDNLPEGLRELRERLEKEDEEKKRFFEQRSNIYVGDRFDVFTRDEVVQEAKIDEIDKRMLKEKTLELARNIAIEDEEAERIAEAEKRFLDDVEAKKLLSDQINREYDDDHDEIAVDLSVNDGGPLEESESEKEEEETPAEQRTFPKTKKTKAQRVEQNQLEQNLKKSRKGRPGKGYFSQNFKGGSKGFAGR